jgi:hypothetical protein
VQFRDKTSGDPFAKLRLAKLKGVRWEHFYDHLKETE